MGFNQSDRVRVLIVSNSSRTGLLIAGTLQSDPEIGVVDMCRSDGDVIEKINSFMPDVITLDAQFPDEEEIKRLNNIMRNRRLPIVMLGAENIEYEDTKELALKMGAAYFLSMPRDFLENSNGLLKKDLIKKVHMAKNIKYNHIEKSFFSQENETNNLNFYSNNVSKFGLKSIIAIGASTGGPGSLQSVIPYLPKNLPAAYLIVQHMPPGFTKSMAERLNQISQITVKEAENNEQIKAGVAYIAPGGLHMLVKEDKFNDVLRIELSKEPPKNCVRPSADMLFDSLAEIDYENLVGVIMTGMGCDGRDGLINMKKKNKAVIMAESEESCVVYGMPKAVVRAGIADRVIPAVEITNEIINYVGVDRNGYEPVH